MEDQITLTRSELVDAFRLWQKAYRAGTTMTVKAADAMPDAERCEMDAKTLLDYLAEVRAAA